MIWTPAQLAEIVRGGRKRNHEAYLKIYNSLNGEATGSSLAAIAGVTKQAISQVIQTWEAEGIVANVGTASQPRYRRLMSIPNRAGKKGKVAANGDSE